MAIYGESLTIQYVAWDTTNNSPKTGDAANHTLRWVKDGTAAAPTNSPSEVDATNAPGVYKLTLTASETQCWVGTLCGKSSTSGVVIMPVTLTFERLPTAAPGDTNGLPIIGVAPLTNLDAQISEVKAKTDKLEFVGNDVKATLDGEAVIVGGYLANQSPSSQIQTLGYTAERAEKLDNLDAAISSRLDAGDYIAPDNASIAAIKGQTDKLHFSGDDVKATLDGETVTVGTNQDKTGYTLTSEYDRAKSALSHGEYTAPDNESITAIKEQTDKIHFTGDPGYEFVLASATVDVDEQAIADAVVAEIQDQNLVQVVVQPLVANVQRTDGDGGTITLWRYARLKASWSLDEDVSGHDLVLIIYRSDTGIAVAECDGDEITITPQSTGCLVSVNADDSLVPAPGLYSYVLRDLTTDCVLLSGQCAVKDAPDAS